MQNTPKSNRLHIGIFGRTNTGKSSLLNFISGQDVAITSSEPGTTTDVVEKTAELLPLGPVVLLDTAGLDDTSTLGASRIEKTKLALQRSDIAVLVVEADQWTDFEENVAQSRKPLLIVINKSDTVRPSETFLAKLRTYSSAIHVMNTREEREKHLPRLKELLQQVCPDDLQKTQPIAGDLLPPGGLAVLVVPIDLQAPKGRLILPQVQTIRDLLDHDAMTLVVKERELAHALSSLGRKPDLVICDSQTVLKVTADVPPEIKCTTFSILFARAKGDLNAAARGAAALNGLKPGDRVLIAEGCSHHSLEDDIGRVKIPRWLRQYVGADLDVHHFCGRDFPKDLNQYKLAIHCGACTLTRREMLNRIEAFEKAGVPVTNYGVTISFVQGVLKRVLSPFPSAALAYQQALNQNPQP